VRDYLALAHLSVERGHQRIARELALVPLLDFRMRLGEGTGAALAMPLMDAACAIFNEMATFQEAGVSEKAVTPAEAGAHKDMMDSGVRRNDG
jgi:nicotinate-nucleotide--dimethylbenzimidazole phosphoribosyltransferase